MQENHLDLNLRARAIAVFELRLVVTQAVTDLRQSVC